MCSIHTIACIRDAGALATLMCIPSSSCSNDCMRFCDPAKADKCNDPMNIDKGVKLIIKKLLTEN